MVHKVLIDWPDWYHVLYYNILYHYIAWLLQECPSVKDAYNLIKSHSAEWSELGLELDISRNFRNTLRRDPKLSDNGRLEEILEKWIESDSEDAPATWSFLIEALKGIELRSVIADVEKFLKTPKAAKSYGKFPIIICNLVQNVFSYIGAQSTCILYIHVVFSFSHKMH